MDYVRGLKRVKITSLLGVFPKYKAPESVLAKYLAHVSPDFWLMNLVLGVFPTLSFLNKLGL